MSQSLDNIRKEIFEINSKQKFDSIALEIFKYQSEHVPIYKNYLKALNIASDSIKLMEDIPFLPIDFFKSHDVLSQNCDPVIEFKSSGTTGISRSKHKVVDLEVYEKSVLHGFQNSFGSPEDFCFLALLPNYLEQGDSSLVYMVDKLIKESKQEGSGFFLDNYQGLVEQLLVNESKGVKTFLIGVTYALLDLAENRSLKLKNTIICETGGMKGRRKELIRSEVHEILSQGFGLEHIHSEYGMTELLSQAWSKGKGLFQCPPWMKIRIRELNDPLSFAKKGKTGGVNVIDLANMDSCSFISTSDLGRLTDENNFEILGRFDHSEVRGCNLMVV